MNWRLVTLGQIADGIAAAVLAGLGPYTKCVRVDDCGASRRRVLAAIAAGELRGYRVGRGTYVEREDLDAWIMRPEHEIRPRESQPEADEPTDEAAQVVAMQRRRSTG